MRATLDDFDAGDLEKQAVNHLMRVNMQPAGQKLLDILAAIEQAEKDLLKKKRTQEKSTIAYRLGFWVFWGGVVSPALLSLILALSVWLGAPRPLGYVSIGLLAFAYLVIFFYPFFGAWLYRGALWNISRAPFASILKANVERPMQVDGLYLPQLTALPKTELKLGIMELKNERANFAQRIALFSGPIEKLGILPGLLALLVTIQKLDGQPDWVHVIAYANILVFIMALIAHYLLTRYDRMIALSELALSQKEEDTKATTRTATHPIPA